MCDIDYSGNHADDLVDDIILARLEREEYIYSKVFYERLCRKIDSKMSSLDERDAEGFCWWIRFKEFLTNNLFSNYGPIPNTPSNEVVGSRRYPIKENKDEVCRESEQL